VEQNKTLRGTKKSDEGSRRDLENGATKKSVKGNADLNDEPRERSRIDIP